MDPKTQLEAARTTVLAVPRADLTTLVVTGKDRVSWLNGLLTCDLVKRPPEAAAYGLAVARNGRVLSDAIVVVDERGAQVLVAVPVAPAAALREHLDHYLVMEDVEVAQPEGVFEVWALHGPKAVDVAEGLVRASGAVAGRLDATGLGGAVVFARSGGGDGGRAAVEREVKAAGGLAGDEAGWNALRLERAIPRFGIDFDERTYPQEAALEKTAVSFDKGCYLGQEVVCMLEMRGHVKRRLVALVLDGVQTPAAGAPVADAAGTAVGEVTSADWSPTLEKPVALAMVKRGHGEAGARVSVDGARAEVVERPA